MTNRVGKSEKTIRLFGFTFDDLSIERVSELISEPGGYRYVVTPNVDHAVRLNNNRSEFGVLYDDADYVLCDSKIIHLLSRLLKRDIEHIVPGSDLTPYLFDHVIQQDDGVAVLGSSSADMTVLREKYALQNLHQYNPPMGFIDKPEEVEKCIDFFKSIDAKYIFLAVGSPRQEIIAHRLRETLDSGVALCIGASIDFITGKSKRAPIIWQTLHLEWFYRFLQEPRRLFRRYFIDGWKLIGLVLGELRDRS